MTTIAVFAAKGGAGKTTLSIHLAVAASLNGHRVAIFDADRQQQSAIRWADARRMDSGFEEPRVLSVDPRDVRARLADAEVDGYEITVIDCPPRVDAKTAAILAVADLIVIPVMPSALDVGALDTTLPLVAASGKRAHLVLTACASRAREVDEAVVALSSETTPLAPVRLGYTRAYARSLAGGRTATETEPRGPAAMEIAALLEYLLA